MDFILSRYRNLSVLLLVVFGQLILLAYQVRSNQQVRLLRVWSVTAVTPMARGLEDVRSSVRSFFSDYLILLDVREENRRVSAEVNRLKLENSFLKTQLDTADRAKALIEFKGRSPSKLIAARIISTSTSAKTVVFVDRGTVDGVYKGMAVITGDGIVGKVLDSFPTAAQVQLITDEQFGAGVVSQKNHVYGTLQGQGHNRCLVDRVQNEEKVEPDEMFYTTGEDRVFPKGQAVGRVVSVSAGPTFKQIEIVPAAIKNELEEVLIVLEAVHQEIPPPPASPERINLIPAPPGTDKDTGAIVPAGTPSSGLLMTDADRVAARYRAIEDQRGVKLGAFGSSPPSFATIPALPGKESPPRPSAPPATAAPKPASAKPPEKPVQ